MDLSIEGLSKVEGHASLTVKVRSSEVKYARLEIEENRRYFEEMAVGQHYKHLPDFLSRICGTCSPAHFLTAVEAIEKAFNVPVSWQSRTLRNLIENGMFIRDHILHLYVFSLPDYFKKNSILEFKGRQHEELHRALRLMRLGSLVSKTFGGRALHPLSARVGGFKKLPAPQELERARKALEAGREDAVHALKLFASFDYPCRQETVYSALLNDDYTFLDGMVCSSNGLCIQEKFYLKYLKEYIVPYSKAKLSRLAGQEFFVGALARYNLNSKNLHWDTRKTLKELKVKFICWSPFSNNLAQAIEVLHCIDQSLDLIDRLRLRHEPLEGVQPKKVTGIGLTEAPRGTLYHAHSFNMNGVVVNSNIVVPTAQNARSIEKDVALYLPKLLHLPKKQISLELEKLIRAYDPCFSCSTHFLKVKWV